MKSRSRRSKHYVEFYVKVKNESCKVAQWRFMRSTKSSVVVARGEMMVDVLAVRKRHDTLTALLRHNKVTSLKIQKRTLK
jgi:hypothetical protein